MKKKLVISLLIVGLVVSLAMPLVYAKKPKITTALVEEITKSNMVPLNVLIETRTLDYGSISSVIESGGGKVTQTFKYAKGIAAEISYGTLIELKSHPDVITISKDEMRSLSSSDVNLASVNALDHELRAGTAFGLNSENYKTTTLSPMEVSSIVSPTTYANPTTMHAEEVWAADSQWGEDTLVAVIDTGIYPDHFMLQGTIIGGVDMSYDAGDPLYGGWDAPTNHYHGTHVAGIIGGHGGIIVPEDDLLAQSIEYHTGTPLPSPGPGYKLIWLLGMAPFAQQYAIKVFDHTGGSVPESMIIAGIEHAISMKEDYEIDVDVISMSLGGGTLFDGRDLEDTVVDYATSIGITVVTSAGNEGPASTTVGSPGTANTAISVAAAAHPINTRVFWDNNYNWLTIGDYLYTTEDVQIYAFSSRGPTSDGRAKPDVSATGMFVLSAITPVYGELGWASGTSMACPAVSGTVALLNTWSERHGDVATPYDYKEAIVGGADPIPYYNSLETGSGYLNAWNSFNFLLLDSLGTPHPPLPTTYSNEAVAPFGMEIDVSKGPFTDDISDLAPGHAKHYYFMASPNIKSISVKIKDVDYGFDILGMNSFEVYVQSGIRSTYAYYIETANVWGTANFLIKDFDTSWSGATIGGVYYIDMPLQYGWTKVVIENDWTSYDDISGTVTIDVNFDDEPEEPDYSFTGSLEYIPEIIDYDAYLFGANFGKARYTLSWMNDWTRYPATDLDMTMYGLDAEFNVLWFDVAGGTFGSPEMSIHPAKNAAYQFGGKPGDLAYVFLFVDGYTIYPENSPESYVLDIRF